MKKSIFSRFVVRWTMLVPAFALVFFTACNDDDDDPAPTPQDQKTITQIVVEGENFTLLEAAVIRAGLNDELANANGNFTVFAPTDNAFQAAGFADVNAINAVPVDQLVTLLQKHVLNARRDAASLGNKEIITPLAVTKRLIISKNGSTVKVNGATVSSADVAARNGIIHVIDQVIIANSILDAAVSNPNLSLLTTAVVNVTDNTNTNVAELLAQRPAQGNGLTVFAPTNAAFEAATFNQAFLSNATNANAILSILTYHVLPTEVKAAAVPEGPNAEVTTFDNTRKIFATRNARGVFINGIQVADADIDLDNGVVHVIPSVLIPASGNIIATAQANNNFSRLVRVITYVDANISPSPNLVTTLSGNGPFTVFAPVNAAFEFLNKDTNPELSDAELGAVGAQALLGILRRHVLIDRAFSSDLSNNKTIEVVNGTLTVTISGSTITLTPNTTPPTPANVQIANVVTTNGVIHAINAVLR